jgi:hypothetical protein
VGLAASAVFFTFNSTLLTKMLFVFSCTHQRAGGTTECPPHIESLRHPLVLVLVLVHNPLLHLQITLQQCEQQVLVLAVCYVGS